MDWNDLQHVLALSRTGTLSGAGARLGVARTTVGRRVVALEEGLQVLLFDRTPTGFVATAAGEDLVRVAETVEAEVMAVEARVMGRDAQLRGPLRVSTLGFIYRVYNDVFVSFMERYPHVELTVCSTSDLVSLRRREADVVIRMSDSPPEYLTGRRLGRVELGIFGSRELAERLGPNPDLNTVPWIAGDSRSGEYATDQWLSANAPNAKVVMRFDSYEVLRTSMQAGLGVHFIPSFDGDSDPALQKIAGVPGASRDMWALTLAELRSNTRVRAFMDHVHEAMKGRL